MFQNKIFPERLRELMAEHGDTQSSLGRALGIQRQTVNNYMVRGSSPNADMLVKICLHYNVSSDWLLGLDWTTRRKGESNELD